jgi:AcrR family transcriptional regulator
MGRKSERRHRQGDASREAILDAAMEIAAERGYDGTTVAAVTERSGLPASSIYWHFGNKDGLLAATLEHSYREWRRSAPTWDKRVEPEDLTERIESRLHRAAKALAQNPEFWGLGLMLTLEQRVKEPEARRLYLKVREDTEDAITTWWQEVLDGDGGPAEAELARRLARFYMMMMDGMFIQVRGGAGRNPRSQVSLLARGMAAYVSKLGVA